MCGLYMFLWGKSKEVKKVNKTSSEITQKHEATEVIVMSTTKNNENSDCITTTNANCKSNIVANVS